MKKKTPKKVASKKLGELHVEMILDTKKFERELDRITARLDKLEARARKLVTTKRRVR